MKKELKLEQVEINKIEFAQNIINMFNTYNEIDNMFFSIDDYIFSLSISDDKPCSYIKEKTTLNKIGFLSLNKINNLLDYQINNVLVSNQSKLNLSNISINDKHKSCLFHLISIGESLLIKSHLDAYPFEPLFPSQLILSDNIETLMNKKNGCPVLNKYLSNNQIDYLLEDFYINEVFSCIKEIEKEQCSSYPLIKLGEQNRQSFQVKRICFYRETLDTDILSFYGIDLVSKLREISLVNKLNYDEKFIEHVKKKI